jgi:hypothetical protein
MKSLDEARRHVHRMKRLGAISVKSYMQPRREQRQWILQAAREESLLVVPEGGGKFEENLGMVMDGHTGVEHALPITPIWKDEVELFSRSQSGYTPTLLVAYGGLSGEHWFYQHYDVFDDPKLKRFTPRPYLDARAIRRPVMAPDWDWHHIQVAAGQLEHRALDREERRGLRRGYAGAEVGPGGGRVRENTSPIPRHVPGPSGHAA